ncbi:hypothetical protein KYC5002_37320 [Archangium violaceum]|uniref:hypothetical protein n=1 Tax=Archangium violaceum TaxID=83451 RepID=UPI002B29CF01|nr:hypothetical protein KYC5002_37320 [Archangium gephyra]
MHWIALTMVMGVVSTGCAHTQLHPRDTETYVISEEMDGTGGSGGHDCDAEQIECFDRCWNSPPPQTSIKRGSGKHHEACSEKCLEEYMECVNEEEQWEAERKKKELHFLDVATALSWLRSHKTEFMIGTVVVAGGVSFVIATGGSGALLLVPLAL